jgi:cell division inhibitor SepF
VSILTRFKDIVGLNESLDFEEYEYDETQDAYESEPEESRPRRYRSSMRSASALTTAMSGESPSLSNVISMPGLAPAASEVIVMEPRSFEEMPQAIQALRDKKTVVLNLTMMDGDQAQRAVDFVAGGTFAIDGHQERVGESIFLFTPGCVQVTTNIGGELIDQTPRQVSRPAAPTPAWNGESALRMAAQ